jgi:hypothetical protein
MFKDGKDYDVKLPKVAWNKGFDHLDPETRARVNKFLGVGGGAKPGHIVSDETKRKISVANKGRVLGSPSRETLLKITKNFYEGKSYREWAEHYGVTKACIGARMKKNGNPHPYETDYSNRKPSRQPGIFYKGKSAIEWAKELGVNPPAVYNRLKAFGHPYNKKVCKQMGLKFKVDK